jgi:hypothetical protein
LCVVNLTHAEVILTGTNEAKPFSHDQWQAVLDNFVDGDGWIDFPRLKANPQTLQTYLNQLESCPLPPASGMSVQFPTEASKVAYYLNAYHALLLKLTLDAYPTPTVVSVAQGQYHLQFFYRFGGVPITLAELQQPLMAYVSQQPLLAVGISTLTLAGPPLLNEAFDAEHLEQQLARQLERPQSALVFLQKNPQAACVQWLGPAVVSLPNIQKTLPNEFPLPLPRPWIDVSPKSSQWLTKSVVAYCMAPSEAPLPPPTLLMDVYQKKI